MHGFFYSVKENFSFTRKELTELFWTSFVFAFIMTAYFKGFLYRTVVLEDVVIMLIFMILAVFISMFIHVSLQKIVGIKLGYTVTYTYWMNGILICLFLSFMSFGMVPILSTLILPGSVDITQIPKLRLGKFRYGLNAKDIARVSLAGPLAHILIVMLFGIFFLSTGGSDLFFKIILVNLMLAIYSMLPLPKIDIPTRMGGASDGFGLFFFSRPIYIFCALIVVFYAALILLPVWLGFEPTFSFVTAFALACISTLTYGVVIDQKN